MRKKIVAANWKMNMTQAESERFVDSFLRDVGEIADIEVVIIPPFTAIAKVTEALGRAQNIKVGAQNMYWEKSGPYTGEISASLLRDLFVHFVPVKSRLTVQAAGGRAPQHVLDDWQAIQDMQERRLIFITERVVKGTDGNFHGVHKST